MVFVTVNGWSLRSKVDKGLTGDTKGRVLHWARWTGLRKVPPNASLFRDLAHLVQA